MTSSILDTEATSDIPPPDRSYRSICLEKTRAEYSATELLYDIVDYSLTRTYSDRLRLCRVSAWFALNQTDNTVHVLTRSCRLRWCPMCSRVKSNYASWSVTEFLKTVPIARFMTLTLKHSDAPLADQIDRLYDFFRALRRKPEFQLYVDGGVWFFQVKRNASGTAWHPHLHCLITGDFLPKARLSLMWLGVTGDSNIVDVKSVKDLSIAARYVSRYSARPTALADLSPDHYLTVFNAFHSRRLAGTWGKCNAVKLTPPARAPGQDWRMLGTWTFVTRLVGYHPTARVLWQAYLSGAPIASGLSLHWLETYLGDFESLEVDTWASHILVDDNERSPP